MNWKNSNGECQSCMRLVAKFLDKNLQAHLEDFIAMKEIDRESIESRIQDIDAKLCTVELRPVLPLAIFEELAKNEFETIRRSLLVVLAHWLGKERQ